MVSSSVTSRDRPGNVYEAPYLSTDEAMESLVTGRVE